MFSFFKKTFIKIYEQITQKLAPLFGASKINEDDVCTLETILIQSDVGVKTTAFIINRVKQAFMAGKLPDGSHLKAYCTQILLELLASAPVATYTDIVLLVGINGTGKTTTAAKLAHRYNAEGKKTLLIAGDTFRAAAPEQLAHWAQITGCDIYQGQPGQDPASVIFAGCQKFVQDGYQALVIDTAGRLHTKVNLMNELAKIKRVVNKLLPAHRITTLVTIDAMLGQSSIEQARIFKEATDLSGIILTKMDGSAKGGIVFPIIQELHLPIYALSFGEQIDAHKPFNAPEYVHELLGS